MIIPPDPEKDPRLFRESTASLVTIDEDQLVPITNGPTLPTAAYHANPAAPVPYPYGSPFGDEQAVWGNETLPPYDGIRRPNTSDSMQRNGAAAAVPDGRWAARRTLPHGTTLIRTESVASTSSAESSTSRARSRLIRAGPSTISSAGPTVVADQAPKEWEGAASSSRRWRGIPLPPRRHSPPSQAQGSWQRYKKWWITLIAIAGLAVSLAVGLAFGFTTLSDARVNHPSQYMQDRPDSHSQINAWAQQCQHLTYEHKRDGPTELDGVASACNNFTLFNDTSSLTQLAVSSPFFEHYISTFTFPLNGSAVRDYNNTLDHDLFIIARGLAATGTVEFVGVNAPSAVIDGGIEDHVRVDIVARYSKKSDLTDVVNVCKLDRPDGSSGIGIFTPKSCDGDSVSAMLNPLYTPAFHVIIRLPPSLVYAHNITSVYLPGISLELAQMGTRFGNWHNVAMVGKFELTADGRGGGVVVDYLTAEETIIRGGSNTIQGTFNISQRLTINATSGTILANVILNDPNDIADESVSVTSTIPMPHMAAMERRNFIRSPGKDYSPPPIESESDSNSETDTASEWKDEGGDEDYTPEAPKANANETEVVVSIANVRNNTNVTEYGISAPTHLVNTSFMTNEGFIFVAYLHHPPSIALRSLVASQSGMVDVSMHPNFVGPFALENGWGSIRLPPVDPWPESGDPADKGRTRVVCQGRIRLDNSYFALNGINMTENIQAPNSVTGAALWTKRPKNATVADVNGVEGRGSSLAALATLGDLQVTFDGK